MVHHHQQQRQEYRKTASKRHDVMNKIWIRNIRYMIISIALLTTSYHSSLRIFSPSYYAQDIVIDQQRLGELILLSSIRSISNTSSGSTVSTTSLIGDEYKVRSRIHDTKMVQENEVVHATQSDEHRTENTSNKNDYIDPIESGILSQKDINFFRTIQNEIDNIYDPNERCKRYNYTYGNTSSQQQQQQQRRTRRIFYGALIADETMELLHIVATETYQLYSGIVLVESNRTQSFLPRQWKHHHLDDPSHQKSHGKRSTRVNPSTKHPRQAMIASLFGISDINNVLIQSFINEDRNLQSLYREHKQRDMILEGWKQLGMQPDDIGLLADIDETFTRDYLLALQTCDNITQFQYRDKHYCMHEYVKITASTRVYEGSPECITADRYWFHPDIIIGHCIEGIGNSTLHPKAPRANNGTSFLRVEGYGSNGNDWEKESQITNNRYPLWSAADFRRVNGGRQVNVHHKTEEKSILGQNNNLTSRNIVAGIQTSSTRSLGVHTGYHFHNFFMDLNTTRFKYLSYGHPDKRAYTKPIYNLSNDINMMHRCVMHHSGATNESIYGEPASWKWKHVTGGHDAATAFVPIYFMDRDYRQRRHQHVYNMILDDENQMTMWEKS